MDLESIFKVLQSDFDDIQNFQKASKRVLSFLISLNTKLSQRKHNDVSLMNKEYGPNILVGIIRGL